MEKSSDEYDNDKRLQSNKQGKKQSLSKEKIGNINTVSKESSQAEPILNLAKESAYYVYHPPRYALPPYQDPKLVALDLREQIKVICSYHNLISKSIAKQAKTQITSCNLPEPIDSVSSMIIELLGDNNYDKSNPSSGFTDPSQVYVSSKGRLTKRKYYAESDVDPNKDGPLIIQEMGIDESPSRKKAAVTTTRNRNLRQKLNADVLEETETTRKSNTKIQSSSTRQQPKKGNDGFVEPAIPAVSKKNTKNAVQCPICGVHFPEKEVEQHASTCGEIPAEVGNSNSRVTTLRCDSCQQVMSSLEQYEIHRAICSEGGPSNFQS